MVDPLSIAGVIVVISNNTIQTARAIYLLISKYKHAEQTISAIHSESYVISAFLGQIQHLLLRNPDVLQRTFKSQAALEATFDTALSGCTEVYSILDFEVQKLYSNGNSIKAKMKAVWKEDIMKDLLDQVRGRKAALGFLVQGLQLALQLDSEAKLEKLFRDNTAKLEQLAQSISDLRLAHPNSKRPPSVFEAASDDVASLYSNNPNITEASFAYDNSIVTREPYRNVLAYNVQKRSSAKTRAENKTGQQAQSPKSGERGEGKFTEKESKRTDSEGTDERHWLYRLLPENIKLKEEKALLQMELDKTKLDRNRTLENMDISIAGLKRDNFCLKQKIKTQTENFEAQLHAAQAERIELEKTEALIRDQLNSVEASNESYQEHLKEMTSTRVTLRDAHETALSMKSAELDKVEKELEECRITLASVERNLVRKIFTLAKHKTRLKEVQVALADSISQNKVLDRACSQKDNELAQWRQYEAIIAQLRALPNPDPSTPVTPVSRSEHETNSSPLTNPSSLNNSSSPFERLQDSTSSSIDHKRTVWSRGWAVWSLFQS